MNDVFTVSYLDNGVSKVKEFTDIDAAELFKDAVNGIIGIVKHG